MASDANTEHVSALAQLVRDSINECIKVITELEESGRSHEAQISLEWQARFWLENQLVPSVLAAACGLYQSHHGTVLHGTAILNQEMPELISRIVSGLPDAAFLGQMSKLVDPELWAVISANLGPMSKPLAVEAFHDTLNQVIPK
ncbi:MAG: hypothetical protein FJ316_07595 [SAR202 cluster bacterium]|nr:hypothetical protein [SAR202 cluster bacterium]